MLEVFINDVDVETVITILTLDDDVGWLSAHHVEFIVLVYLIGKGTLDNLGYAIQQCYLFIQLLQNQLHRCVVFSLDYYSHLAREARTQFT